MAASSPRVIGPSLIDASTGGYSMPNR
jgi:hypothetical protein